MLFAVAIEREWNEVLWSNRVTKWKEKRESNCHLRRGKGLRLERTRPYLNGVVSPADASVEDRHTRWR